MQADIDSSTALRDLALLIGLRHVAVAFAAINLAAFLAFGIDKARARAGLWRIQESTLLGLALLGGSIGAWGGRRTFRHKTRKQPFNSALLSITLLQVVAAGLGLGWWAGGWPI